MPPPRLHLLEVDPDLAAFLSQEERQVADRLTAPVTTVPPGEFALEELLDDETFAFAVVDGIILSRIVVGGQAALRLLGPGDLITRTGSGGTALLRSSWQAASEVRVALLDDHLLAATRHFPRLVTGLQTRVAEQLQRVSAQMVICQMPRVEDRVLAMLWLLAESWGRTTTIGTVVPITLTHDTLGELIGAKRSTVTLAVTHLVVDGALIRNDRGWLLLERPDTLLERPRSEKSADVFAAAPQLLPSDWSAWETTARHEPLHSMDFKQTRETLSVLREYHRRSAELVRDGLERAASAQERSRALRELINTRRRERQGHHRERSG